MDWPAVVYVEYTMVSAQQMNLLPENASWNDTIFAQSLYRWYRTTLHNHHSIIYIYCVICNVYSTVREVYSRYTYTTQGDVFTEVQRVGINILLRSYIEAMDWHTVLCIYIYYILYIVPWVHNRQAFCLKKLPEMAPFPQKYISHILDHLAMFKFLY